jgi:hypothetical protein
MVTLSAKPEMHCAPSLAPFGRLVWVPEMGGKGMVFIHGAGLTRAQIDRTCPLVARSESVRIGWWQVALRGLFQRGYGA